MKSDFKKQSATSPSSAADVVELHRSLGAGAALHFAPIPSAPVEWADPVEPLVHGVLDALGEDPSREGLERTPHRVAKAMRFLTSGYSTDLAGVVNGAVFDSEGYREMVLVKEIEFYSLCEHHMLPFFGKISVAYLPDKKIIGLSKIPRLVDVFARRLQVQERMTQQVAAALEEILQPRGVAVAATGFHLCMAMRGVEKQASQTTTTAFTGLFEGDRDLRKEFLGLLKDGR
jgi:GTP cyclohydrolase IA